MTTPTPQRLQAMHKLLAVEPERMGTLIACTGWPSDETKAAVHALVAAGQASYINQGGAQFFFALQPPATATHHQPQPRNQKRQTTCHA